ncbi:MAG: ferritin-like domain-containing protein, partial [Gluconacetobacter diazotrophicus]|nr:ferritin-like domain-containing protein [Gluconacetobacter diazotrophicus]
MIELDEKRGFGSALGRRGLLARAGTGAVGTLALGTMGIGGAVATSTSAAAATISDVDVLNFALNLEYL